MANPYVLALTSHKGGTGRTSLALGLASIWSRQGLRVTLVDADPSQASRLIAMDHLGRCSWERFTWNAGPLTDVDTDGCDLILLDAPALTSPISQVLTEANGIILTGLPDLMTLRTLPLATRHLTTLCRTSRSLEFHGLLLNRLRPEATQTRYLEELHRLEDELFLRPEIPEDPAMRTWAATPGVALPDGPAAEALGVLADTLAMRIGLGTFA